MLYFLLLAEKISGRVTGSDTRPDRTLSKALSHQHNLVGEGVVSGNMVDVVKTHWPERRGYCSYKVSKILLLVRNPWDAMDSYFNMMLTNTHTKTLSDSVYNKYSEFYRELVLSEIQTWHNFYRGYLRLAKTQKISLLLIRYEDLVEDTASEMVKIMKFLYPDEDFSERIDQMSNENNTTSNNSYKPRGKRRFGKSFHRYDEELITSVTEKGDPLLSRLGYNVDNMKTQKENWECELQLKYSIGCADNVFHVNLGRELRKCDKFGRGLTAWRRSQTNDDKSPLPTLDDN